MKQKKIPLFLFFTSLFLSLFIIFFEKSMDSLIEPIFKTIGICESYLGDSSCYNWSEVALLGFVFLFINIIFISIFLFFVHYESLIRWYKFAKFAIPITLFLVLLFIVGFKPSTGGFFDILVFDSLFVFVPPVIFTAISFFVLFKNKDTTYFKFFKIDS